MAGSRTKVKGKSTGKGYEKPKSETTEEWCNDCGKWSRKAANCWHEKEKKVHQIQGKAGMVSPRSSQSTLTATDVGTEEIGLIESVCEDAEMSPEAAFVNCAGDDDAGAPKKRRKKECVSDFLKTCRRFTKTHRGDGTKQVAKTQPLTRGPKTLFATAQLTILSQTSVKVSE